MICRIHLVLSLAVALGCAPVLADAAQRRNADREAAAAAQSLAPAAATRQELDAFTPLQNIADPRARLAATDKFLETYPTTQLAGMANRIRMDSYIDLAQYKEAVAAGVAGLDFEFRYMDSIRQRTELASSAADRRDRNAALPVDKNSAVYKTLVNSMTNASLYSYRQLVTASQQLNDPAAVIEYSEKALAINGDELFFLVAASGALAERHFNDEQELGTAMKRAEELGRKAVEQVTTLISGPSGAAMPDMQKASLLNTVHVTMGRLYFNQKRYDESRRSYLAAVAAKKDDGDAYYVLGVVSTRTDPPRIDEAMEAFAKSVYLMPNGTAARDALTILYQGQRKSLDGLDAYIQSQGAGIQ